MAGFNSDWVVTHEYFDFPLFPIISFPCEKYKCIEKAGLHENCCVL
jgi:hypothetical protein